MCRCISNVSVGRKVISTSYSSAILPRPPLIVVLMIIHDEHLFMCLLAICMSSLKKRSTQVFCPFFDWVQFFFDTELYELFICFGY